MNDYDELYEDDFENDEIASAAGKSFSSHVASMTTPHFSSSAIHGTASNGGVATATAVGFGGVAAKRSRVMNPPPRPTCSLDSSFSSYQSSSSDPLLPSAHELCSSSSWHSSTSSSRHHSPATRPAKDCGSTRRAAESGKGRRAFATAGSPNAVVLASGYFRTVASPKDPNAVTLTYARPSIPQAPEQHEITSSAQDAYAELHADDRVQVIVSGAGKQTQWIPTSETSTTNAEAISCTSLHSTPSTSSLPGRARSSHRHEPSAKSNSVSAIGAKLPQHATAVAHASRSSSPLSSSTDDDDDTGDCGQRHNTFSFPFATAAAPAAAVAAGIVTAVTRNVSAERNHSCSGSAALHSGKKLLHQSNYTSLDVLDSNDGHGHCRTPAEIDAAAAAVDDEEEGEVDHNNLGASATVPSEAAARRQRMTSSSSGCSSDSFTSPTPSALVGPSLTNRQRTQWHNAAIASSSSMSPTPRTSLKRTSLLGRSDSIGTATGSVMPLSLPPQQQPPSLPRIHTGAVPPDFRTDHSSSRQKDSAASMKLRASGSHSTSSMSALSSASLKMLAAGNDAVRSVSQRRQVSGAATKTIDARLFNGVYGPQSPRTASGEDDDNNSHVEKMPRSNMTAKQPPPPSLPRLNSSQTSATTSRGLPFAKMVVAKTKGYTETSTAAAEDDDPPEPDERMALLARVAQLQEDIATWDRRIEQQRALMNAGAGKSGNAAVSSLQRHSADAAGAARRRTGFNGGKQRSESVQNASPKQTDTKGGRRSVNTRLAKLRQENEHLEAQYARQGAGTAGMCVQTFVVRADVQLQKVRQQLKEVTAARRALENRDKRAAHTIEEVHRRMPTADELEERQLKEGIYSRTSLLRTVKELKANIKRTRAATKLMEMKCGELDAHVRHKRLSSITPKEYEALCASRDANAKRMERHKTAISVYAAAFAQDARSCSKSAASGFGAGGGATQSSRSSRTTSPRASSVSPAGVGVTEREQKQVLAEYEVTKADLLLQQKRALHDRKQELQASIDELWLRIQKRNEQIKANHAVAGLNYVDTSSVAAAHEPLYVVGNTGPKRLTPASTSPMPGQGCGSPVAGSSAAAVRKGSLRDLLRSSLKRRTEATTAAEGAKGGVDATTVRLCGVVAGERKRSQENANANALHRGSKPLPALTQTGNRIAAGDEIPISAAAAGTTPSRPSRLALSRDTIEDEDAAHGSIEAILQRIDADNRQLCQGVFEQGRREGAAPPRLWQGFDNTDAVKAADSVHSDAGDYTGGMSQCDPATSRAARPHGVYDEEKIDEAPMEEEVIEEELDAGKSDGSGRSTPEWLRKN
nr:unnamed protein product [Leishmania braziliensis]